MLKILLVFIVVLLCIKTFAQCPDYLTSQDFVINTQEKYDKFLLDSPKYPDCKKWEIVLHNGKFIGEPKRAQYLFTFLAILSIILFSTRFFVTKYNPLS